MVIRQLWRSYTGSVAVPPPASRWEKWERRVSGAWNLFMGLLGVAAAVVFLSMLGGCVALPTEISYECEHETEQVDESTATSTHECTRVQP